MGRPIGPNDLMIAAHAHARGTTPVTANVVEFARVRVLAWKTGSPDTGAFRRSLSVAAIPSASINGPPAAYPNERHHLRIALFWRGTRLLFLIAQRYIVICP